MGQTCACSCDDKVQESEAAPLASSHSAFATAEQTETRWAGMEETKEENSFGTEDTSYPSPRLVLPATNGHSALGSSAKLVGCDKFAGCNNSTEVTAPVHFWDSWRPVEAVKKTARNLLASTTQVHTRIQAKPTREDEHCVYFEGERAVFVSDMSGFTRITRKMGIIHFASLIMRMRQLLLPIFANYNVRSVGTEADNFICVFDTAEEAVLAAVEALHILSQYNSKMPNDDFKVIIGGIGIDYGNNLLMDKHSKKLFGEAADNAFNLGEEVASGGDLIITDRVRKVIDKDPRCKGLKYEEGGEDGSRYNKVMGVLAKYSHSIELARIGNEEFVDGTPRGEFLDLLLNKRIALGTETRSLDSTLEKKYIKQCVVLMMGFEWGKVTKENGPVASINLMRETIPFVHEIMQKYNAEIVEEFIFVFHDPVVAILAGLHVRRSIIEHNANTSNGKKIPFKGLASHSGKLLLVPGTDVHWGDPVNTSSKLCEDSSRGEYEFFISLIVYEAIKGDASLEHLLYEQHEFIVSKVNFICFQINESALL